MVDWSEFPATFRDSLNDLYSTHPLDIKTNHPGESLVGFLTKMQPYAAKLDASIKTNPGVIVAAWRISNFFAKQGYATNLETIIIMLPDIIHTIANDLPTVIGLLNATAPAPFNAGGGMGDKAGMPGRK